MKKVSLPSHNPFNKESIDNFKKNQIAELKKQEVIRQLLTKFDVTDEELSLYLDYFIDYLNDYQYCQQCPGFDKCQKSNRHLQLCLYRKDDTLERTVCYCPVMKRIKDADKMFYVRDFPDDWCGRYLEQSSNRFFDINRERVDVIKKMLDLIMNKSTNGIYLYGESRLGKSYLLSLFVQKMLKETTQKCCFIDFPIRLRQLNDLSFSNKEEFNKTLEMYMNCEYLVLDDFGNEYKNDYVRDTIIYPLLSYRLKEKKPTYFTSQYSLKDIEILYGGNAASKIKSKQLCEIIRQMVKNETVIKGIPIY